MTITSNASARRFSFLRTALGAVLIAVVAASSGSALADDAAVKCAQKQLNTLGFEAGLPDGIVGVKTFLAGERYIDFMTANAETGWKQPSLSAATAPLWCEKVAEAHAKTAVYWQMYQQQKSEASLEAGTDPQKIYEMAYRLETGGGIRRSEALALKWYTRAARMGHTLAQRNLAEAYHYGYGTTIDYNQARHWYLLAAMQGDAESQYMVGKYYTSTDSIAIDWLWKAAEQGHNGALLALHNRLDI